MCDLVLTYLKPTVSYPTLKIEIGIDEAGRGPLFGRVYAAAVAISDDFDPIVGNVKDSKKYGKHIKPTSTKSIESAATYVKEHSTWHVSFLEAGAIDQINILAATQECMNDALNNVRLKLGLPVSQVVAIVDGNCFMSKSIYDPTIQTFMCIDYVTVVKGDSIVASIAAASVLAKTARDAYILDLCEQHPKLDEMYDIASNKGYGAKKHLAGLHEHGITKWHRKTFGCCKTLPHNQLINLDSNPENIHN